ncbi:MAG: DUF1146 family protein [Erysipelotrichaceae bacterium]
MQYRWVVILTHLFSFALSFYALSGIHFDKFVNVRKPQKAQLLLLLLSMGLGFLVAQFLLILMVN